MKSLKPGVCEECDMHDGHRPSCSRVSNEMQAFMAKHVEDQKREYRSKLKRAIEWQDTMRHKLRGRLAFLASDTRLSDRERAAIRKLNEELSDTTLDALAAEIRK